ncbi:DUF1638 domain-containing protein [Maritalea mediterranea]|uniref:DUF1638 domain-containing protein n=1 Tax=Maritalea mediterranea TaxID=2909667 RepID=A0ABS9EA93_9HYPH|nr:DUF1638 domain-containing protein [Maritalea mediterranea]MCF4098343.1 DUF1638 domain-containing protein [Maritalea mediterranea]
MLSNDAAHQNETPRVGIVSCGALAREILQLQKQLGGDHWQLKFLPAELHARPRDIPAAVDAALAEMAEECDQLLVGYADCGTAGKLDHVLEKYKATRLEGAHCYAFFLGLDEFDVVHDHEPGTFYLTDYLVRQFDTLVFKPLGLDQHPELRDAYFGNYTRLLYLRQNNDPKLNEKALHAAKRLGLRLEIRDTGYGDLEPFLNKAS